MGRRKRDRKALARAAAGPDADGPREAGRFNRPDGDWMASSTTSVYTIECFRRMRSNFSTSWAGSSTNHDHGRSFSSYFFFTSSFSST